MRVSRTHFEQIPVEVVKTIAEPGVSKDRKTTSTDSRIVERISKKTEPQTMPARSRARKGR
jgi:hypothetical protein